ncbi:VTT domain-containing protein [Pelagibacteraceae bacterium]|nr:VTT domain-containing protein [Pelagibacteraceae bacterium]
MTNQIIKSFIIIFFLASMMAGFFFDIGQYLSFETIKEQHEKLILLIESNFIFYFILFFFIYIIVTAFALPFAAIKTVLAGALFGLIPGVILTSFASSIGSTLCFLMSRFVLRDFVQNKYSKYLDKINKGIKEDGIYYLFFLRLSPIFPFFIINLVFGLTKMKTMTFYMISQIGMLIGTVIFVNAGVQLSKINSMSDILNFNLILSFILIGLVPLIIKKLIQIIKK